MVPRTPNRAASYESFEERAMVMRAVGSYGKELFSYAREQHLFCINMADQRGSFRKIVNRQT
jgi:hypothetical protein